MQIFFKSMDGRTFAIQIFKHETIRDMKIKIQEKIGCHPDNHKLIFQGAILHDDKSADECGICDKSVINVLVRQR